MELETPMFMTRVTRSQTASLSQKKQQLEETGTKNTPYSERKVLLDITNDSPIVGLAAGRLHSEKTPSSKATKTLPRPKNTPGSGEALLRGQVKTLLQRVEEECGVAVTKPVSAQIPPFRALLALSRSPAQLLAPTPANTPQIGSVSVVKDGLDEGFVLPCVLEQEEEEPLPKQDVSTLTKPVDLGECMLNRALLFDSPKKSESSSSLTCQESVGSYLEKSSEDDNSSIWSIQVNVSSEKDEFNDEELLDEDDYDYDWEADLYEEAEDTDDCFDELCDGLSKMSMLGNEDTLNLPKGQGKHKRFFYDSNGELEREEEVIEKVPEAGVLVMRGLPVPEGKHLRFPEEDED